MLSSIFHQKHDQLIIQSYNFTSTDRVLPTPSNISTIRCKKCKICPTNVLKILAKIFFFMAANMVPRGTSSTSLASSKCFLRGLRQKKLLKIEAVHRHRLLGHSGEDWGDGPPSLQSWPGLCDFFLFPKQKKSWRRSYSAWRPSRRGGTRSPPPSLRTTTWSPTRSG